MWRAIFCLVICQIVTFGHAFATQPSDFLRQQFQMNDIIFLGELHTGLEHKTLLTSLLRELSSSGTIDGFALEFSKGSSQSVLDQYLADEKAVPGSEQEKEYLLKLNRQYQNMFNVPEYDEVMRVLKEIWKTTNGKFQVCAVDGNSVRPDSGPDGEKFKILNGFPINIQTEITQSSGQTLQQKALEADAIDREVIMATNISNCVRKSKKTLVFVGSAHATRWEKVLLQQGPRSAEKFLQILNPDKKVRSALIAQGFATQDLNAVQLPFFSQKCFSETASLSWQAYLSEEVPVALKKSCLELSNEKSTFDYSSLFDFVILGPPGHEIDPNPNRF